MRLRNVNRLVSLLLMGWLLASCGGGGNGVKPEKTNMNGFASIHAVNSDRTQDTTVWSEEYGAGSSPYKPNVSKKYDFGGIAVYPPDKNAIAEAEVFVSESGETYWVSAESTAGWFPDLDAPIGSHTFLAHILYYRKTKEDATLRFVVSDILLEGMDYSGTAISQEMCPWKPPTLFDECDKVMYAKVDFTLVFFPFPGTQQSYRFGGEVTLRGVRGQWKANVYTYDFSTDFLWNEDSFTIGLVNDDDIGWYEVRLASPITIEIPLELTPVGETFIVVSQARARAHQSRNIEAYMGAYFRDPVSGDGLNVSYEGLEPIEPLTADIPTPAAPTPAPACENPNPAAGTIQFAQASYTEPEIPGSGAEIIVTRTGGSQGRVSARFTTGDDTALAGEDYEAVDTFVLFADGEVGSRVVHVPIILNDIEEPDKTLNLTLSEPGGCATLGEQRTATLTILDDDRPIIRTNYTVGGTVTGLEGSGLTLSNFGEDLGITSSGPFVFSRRYGNALQYDVRVKTQPTNPAQVCIVTNGSGTIQNANVTNILATCTEPSPVEDGLDPSFGAGGKLTVDFFGGYDAAKAVLILPDGKIVIGGEAQNGTQYGLGLIRILP